MATQTFFKTLITSSLTVTALLLMPIMTINVTGIDLSASVHAKGDNGGGRGGGHGAGHDKDRNQSDSHGNGHAKHDHVTTSSHNGEVHSSDLGSLNAAHASENARKNAAPGSTVGLIAEYERQVTATEGDAEAQAADAAEALNALESASNKELSPDVIDAVNELLGIDEPNARVDQVKAQLNE
jgi:hypothetical protein